MARDRDDEDDEVDDDRPRRRRPRDDDDDDDRPSKKDRGPLDGTFADTNIVVLVLFALCCGLIAFILALICYLTAKDPKAKSNAMIVLGIDLAWIVIVIILNVAGVLGGLGR